MDDDIGDYAQLDALSLGLNGEASVNLRHQSKCSRGKKLLCLFAVLTGALITGCFVVAQHHIEKNRERSNPEKSPEEVKGDPLSHLPKCSVDSDCKNHTHVCYNVVDHDNGYCMPLKVCWNATDCKPEERCQGVNQEMAGSGFCQKHQAPTVDPSELSNHTSEVPLGPPPEGFGLLSLASLASQPVDHDHDNGVHDHTAEECGMRHALHPANQLKDATNEWKTPPQSPTKLQTHTSQRMSTSAITNANTDANTNADAKTNANTNTNSVRSSVGGVQSASSSLSLSSSSSSSSSSCAKADCDDPTVRDTYTSTSTLNLHMKFHVVEGREDKTKLQSDIQQAYWKTVNVFKAQGINVGAAIEYYTNEFLSGAIVGFPFMCDIENTKLGYDSTQPFAVKESVLIRPYATKPQTNVKTSATFYPGDEVDVSINSTKNDAFKACVVRCDGDNCVTEIKCVNASDGKLSLHHTFTTAGYQLYAIAITNTNGLADASLNAHIGWVRSKSCLSQEEWKAHIHTDWASVAPVNVYVSDLGTQSIKGWANLPWNEREDIGSMQIDHADVNEASTTLPHELGHVLGLWHTFHGREGGECVECTERLDQTVAERDHNGDFCSDTLPMPKRWDCFSPRGQDTCSQRFWSSMSPWDNIMSYGSCRSKLTAQQGRRMRCFIDTSAKPFL